MYPAYNPGQGEFAVRIKPEDMPTDDEALELFSIYFEDIHPYIPIVNKAAFYRQWNTSRDSISPLLLETIFACAGRMSSDPSRGLKWIIMASSKTSDPAVVAVSDRARTYGVLLRCS